MRLCLIRWCITFSEPFPCIFCRQDQRLLGFTKLSAVSSPSSSKEKWMDFRVKHAHEEALNKLCRTVLNRFLEMRFSNDVVTVVELNAQSNIPTSFAFMTRVLQFLRKWLAGANMSTTTTTTKLCQFIDDNQHKKPMHSWSSLGNNVLDDRRRHRGDDDGIIYISTTDSDTVSDDEGFATALICQMNRKRHSNESIIIQMLLSSCQRISYYFCLYTGTTA